MTTTAKDLATALQATHEAHPNGWEAVARKAAELLRRELRPEIESGFHVDKAGVVLHVDIDGKGSFISGFGPQPADLKRDVDPAELRPAVVVPVASGRAIAAVVEERGSQNLKWGEQNHPDGTGPETHPLLTLGPVDISAEELAGRATNVTDSKAKDRAVTWRDILLEEVFEALAEEEPAKLQYELIQVAAVATQWAEAITRRGHQDQA